MTMSWKKIACGKSPLSRVDRDRAPRIWQDSTDSRWHLTVDGKSFDVPGLKSLIGEGCRGIWDVETRLADMDAEGIDVSVCCSIAAP